MMTIHIVADLSVSVTRAPFVCWFGGSVFILYCIGIPVCFANIGTYIAGIHFDRNYP